MNILIREYNQNDLEAMIEIWNQVVEDGIAFPQEELLKLLIQILIQQQLLIVLLKLKEDL